MMRIVLKAFIVPVLQKAITKPNIQRLKHDMDKTQQTYI